MKQLFIYTISLFFLLNFSNCNKDENPDPEPTPPVQEQLLIGEEYAIGLGMKVSYYAYENPFVGYNKIYFEIQDSISNEVINENLHIILNPIMDMGMMMHSCPTEAVIFDESAQQYSGAAVFVMPSTAGTWTLNVIVADTANGLEGTAVFNLEVIQPEEARLVSFVSDVDPTASYFVSIIQPQNPIVGENEFEILINRRASMMDWPYEPYLNVEIEPEMPAMNHGSPNNVNPVQVGQGHYVGVVNFTMTGWWRINMLIKNGEGSVINDDSYFDITFQ
jgi:hypothetical protein